ncbi:MAG: cytochrome c biogenesis protein CcdA [Candidatus Omnitrophica bacterium]|nr:cytochrome c biogenesis protein CcdA [Candidatus Omnitrophota bacterium]
MDNVNIGIAFAAGIFSFLSPCVLPLVPAYISFISGMTVEELRAPASTSRSLKRSGILSVAFVAGFSVIFMALGASATLIGRLLSEHMWLFTRIAGIVIILLGLHLTGIIRIGWLNYSRKINVSSVRTGYAGAFVVGMAFGFGWTPCVGPILAGILALAATQETLVRGMLLLGVYSLGLGLPFIITGFAVGAFMRFFERYKKAIRVIEVVAGILLILIGILIFFGDLQMLLSYMPDFFYRFNK